MEMAYSSEASDAEEKSVVHRILASRTRDLKSTNVIGVPSVPPDSPQSSQFLQTAPILEPVPLCPLQELARVSCGIELVREASFGARKGDEIDGLTGLRINVPVLLDGGVALQAQAFADAIAFPRSYTSSGKVRDSTASLACAA